MDGKELVERLTPFIPSSVKPKKDTVEVYVDYNGPTFAFTLPIEGAEIDVVVGEIDKKDYVRIKANGLQIILLANAVDEVEIQYEAYLGGGNEK